MPGSFIPSASAVPVPRSSALFPSIVLMPGLSALSASAMPVPESSALYLSAFAVPVAVLGLFPSPFLNFVY